MNTSFGNCARYINCIDTELVVVLRSYPNLGVEFLTECCDFVFELIWFLWFILTEVSTPTNKIGNGDIDNASDTDSGIPWKKFLSVILEMRKFVCFFKFFPYNVLAAGFLEKTDLWLNLAIQIMCKAFDKETFCSWFEMYYMYC